MAHPSDLSSKPRALITGSRGFTGRYLAVELEAAGYQVFGTVHGGESPSEFEYPVDLCDREQVRKLIEKTQPDVVAHLAAISFVAHGDIDAIYRVNIMGTRNLLEALANIKARPRAVLVASSANIYGNSQAGTLSEAEPAAPANDYAISKLAVEHVARLWMDKLPIIVTRPFNYTGVGQSANFLIPKIIQHFQQRASKIELGNLDVERDFSDVRTVVKVYARLLSLAPAGLTINICSGQGVSLRQILKLVEVLAGYQIEVNVNPAFVRVNEVRKLIGNPEKLKQMVGAVPIIPISETLAWMLSDSCEVDML
jgi:nucleoside-diphosphate-sugar epimerase